MRSNDRLSLSKRGPTGHARRMATASAIVTIFSLTGCPNPEPTRNPARLWLALDGTETMVRLVPQEPIPF